jgi:hypothetical protein
MQNFKKIFAEQLISNTDIQIISSHPITGEMNFSKNVHDCMYGRMLCSQGVYACPFLAGDYRGRLGCSFKDYSKNMTAETDFCVTCSCNQGFMFAIG